MNSRRGGDARSFSRYSLFMGPGFRRGDLGGVPRYAGAWSTSPSA